MLLAHSEHTKCQFMDRQLSYISQRLCPHSFRNRSDRLFASFSVHSWQASNKEIPIKVLLCGWGAQRQTTTARFQLRVVLLLALRIRICAIVHFWDNLSNLHQHALAILLLLDGIHQSFRIYWTTQTGVVQRCMHYALHHALFRIYRFGAESRDSLLAGLYAYLCGNSLHFWCVCQLGFAVIQNNQKVESKETAKERIKSSKE